MKHVVAKIKRRLKRKLRIRSRIIGKPECPRITVFRSNKYFYAQVIDDSTQKTLFATSSQKGVSLNRVNVQKQGKEFGALLKKNKVKTLVFDRNGFMYHGLVKEFAEALRAEGITL